jgi:hypothetical protein
MSEPTEHEIKILYENTLCQIISLIDMCPDPRTHASVLDSVRKIACAGAQQDFGKILPHYVIGTEPEEPAP